MIKILITDDEKLIRAGIKKIIQTALCEYGEDELKIYEAKNGEEAFRTIYAEQINILITDIRMPVMDGIELMKKVSKENEKPSIIVLSGFDDFSYAKAAIASGALSYVLKPIDKTEFIDAVKKAIKEEQKKMSDRNKFSAGDNLKTVPMQFPGSMECVCVYGENMLKAVREKFELEPVYYIEKTDSYCVFICSGILREDFFSVPVFSSASVGISENFSAWSDIKKMQGQSFTALLSCFFTQGNDLYRREGVYLYSGDYKVTDFSKVDEAYEKCISSIKLLKMDNTLKLFESLTNMNRFPVEKRPAVLNYIYNKFISNLFNLFPGITENDSYLHTKETMIEKIMNCDNLYQWKSYVKDYIIYIMAILRKQGGDNTFISTALEYLNKNFRDTDLTMATVSNYVDVNYTWFSEKFKEQTGFSFNDYLKRLRLEEAKRLLEQGFYKVYEVAAKCGYKDVKYFMKLFREETGFKPSEWAELKSRS